MNEDIKNGIQPKEFLISKVDVNIIHEFIDEELNRRKATAGPLKWLGTRGR